MVTRRQVLYGVPLLLLGGITLISVDSKPGGRAIDALYQDLDELKKLKLVLDDIVKYENKGLDEFRVEFESQYTPNSVEQLNQFVAGKIKDDFENKRVINVSGWILAEFECKIALLYG